MIETIEGFPEGVVAMRAGGRVTADDYRTILMPAIDRATAGGRKARLLFEVRSDFDGDDLGAFFRDAQTGMRHMSSFERIAMVTDVDWIRRGVQVYGGFLPAAVRLFPMAAAADAEAWIRG